MKEEGKKPFTGVSEAAFDSDEAADEEEKDKEKPKEIRVWGTTV